jgi:hypothetical protein
MKLEMFGKKFKVRKFSPLHWLMIGVFGVSVLLPVWATAVFTVGLLR